MKCIDLAMAILFIVLVSAFLGWGFFYKETERTGPASSTKPLLSKVDSFDEENEDTPDVKVNSEHLPVYFSLGSGNNFHLLLSFSIIIKF